ncbi:hypothetical protein TWF506_011341 [Arthrobotrys conoides]|uniref:Uncharacterized protein n=1 Tax=Arthrobotrys conoides TaxID=74498 RepID=A0AAN8RUM7_9PEZI
MPMHPATPSQTSVTGPRFCTPDHWNETGEEIEFTPWEQDAISLKPGTKLKSIIPKQPKRPRGRPPNKSKGPSNKSKASPATRTYKSRCKVVQQTKDSMETNLTRKPRGKRVLPGPETLMLTRFKPVGYSDPIEKAGARAKGTTSETKKLEITKKPENTKKVENKKKLEIKKRQPPPQNKMPPQRSVPTDVVLDRPGRPKKWFEDIDEDLLRGTKWARQLNQNSLQREYGNPGVLPQDRIRKTYNDSIATKQNAATIVKPAPPAPPATSKEAQKKPEQTTPARQGLDCIRKHSLQPIDTVSPHRNQQAQNKTALKPKEQQAKPQLFGFESFQFDDVSEGELERLGKPFSGAQEDARFTSFDNFSFENVSESEVEMIRKPITVVQQVPIDKPAEPKKQADNFESFANFSFESVSESDFGLPKHPINVIQEDGSKPFVPEKFGQSINYNDTTHIDIDSTAVTRVPKTCLPAASKSSFDYSHNGNETPQMELRLRELEVLRQRRDRALMQQMEPGPAGTPYVQVPRTQPVPEVVKNTETTNRVTRSVTTSGKKRARGGDMEEENEEAKRRKCSAGTREGGAGKPGSDAVRGMDMTDREGNKQLGRGAKKTLKPREGNKRATKKKAKKTPMEVERALTWEEAKRLARQNPGKQFAFDLDDKSQD